MHGKEMIDSQRADSTKFLQKKIAKFTKFLVKFKNFREFSFFEKKMFQTIFRYGLGDQFPRVWCNSLEPVLRNNLELLLSGFYKKILKFLQMASWGGPKMGTRKKISKKSKVTYLK